jgi:hypothetical protein
MIARLRDEQGFALPVVLAIMVVALLLLVAMMSQNISATDTAKRDTYQRQALQAAEAGLDLAEYRANALSLDASSLLKLQNGLGVLPTQCVVQVSGALSVIQLPTIGQWCDDSTSEAMGNGASYSYRISPPASLNVTLNPSGDLVRCQDVVGLLSVLTCTLNGLLGSSTIYQVTNLDKVLRRQIVSTGMAGPGCPSGPRCVKRRVYSTYSFRGQSALPIPSGASGLGALLSGLTGTALSTLYGFINGGDLDLNIRLYGRDAGTFKECSATPPTPSDPASGC